MKYINEWIVTMFWFLIISLSILYMTGNMKIRYIDDNKSDINIHFVGGLNG